MNSCREGLRLLVVEDEAIIAAEIMQRLSRRSAHVIGPADTAEAAYRLATTERPDLVLMDIRLKGAGDGIAAATRIYDDLDVPIVFLTANADPATFQRARTPAQFGYVVKPFSERELLVAIDVAINRHEVERELRKSNLTHAAIAACLPDGVIALDDGGAVRYMNPAAEELTGWQLAESLGHPVDAVVSLVDEQTRTPVALPDRGSVRAELLLRDRAGELVPVVLSATSMQDGGGRVVGRAVTLHDLRSQRQAESTLRQSEARFQSAFEGAGIGMALHSAEGRHLRVNSALCDMLGFTEAELLRRSAEEITAPEDVPRLRAALKSVATGEKKAVHFEKRLIDARGRARWVEVSVSQVDSGEERQVISQLEDIDDRKRLVADLKAMNQRYERFQTALFSLSRDAAVAPEPSPEDPLPRVLRRITETTAMAMDAARVAVWWCAEDDSCFESADVFDRDMAAHSSGQRITPDDVPAMFDPALALDDIIAWNGPISDPRHLAFSERFLDPSGLDSYARANVRSGGRRIGLVSVARRRAVWTNDEKHFLTSIANIVAARHADAERVRIQQRLRETDKMSAVGKLAGGIAHDFNNLLTVINGAADMLQTELPEGDSERRAYTTSILEAVERAATLTRQLLLFARGTPTIARSLQPNEVIESLVKMLRRVLSDRVALSLTLAPDLARARIDAVHLEQVLMNLIVNAGDAMPHGGALQVWTRNRTQREAADAAPPRLVVSSAFVQLCVRDEGSGIAPEVLPRIFEPFYSTKPTGKGTGLGLATVYGIVGQAGGFVTVQSKLGEGSTFEVWIPADVDGKRASIPAEVSPSAPRQAAKVLLVEDDSTVRWTAGRLLRSLGHAVDEARSGHEAMTLLESPEAHFDLMITDVSMPGMTGIELVEQVRVRWPSLPVVMISGYLDDHELEARASATSLLHKPFSAESLSRAVTTALEAAQGP